MASAARLRPPRAEGGLPPAGVEPGLLREASGGDAGVLLAILTEEFWARSGHSNQPMFTKQLSHLM